MRTEYASPKIPLSHCKRLTFYALVFFLLLIIIVFLFEITIRIFSPQNLSSVWRVYSPRGYLLNRAGENARHQLQDRIVSYRFNAYHLRGGPIQENIVKILVLGDSFTFGYLLEEQDTYIHYLQVYADRAFGSNTIQFLNGGGLNWGTSDYLAFLEEFGEKISPEIVIVFLNTDDIGRSMKSDLYVLKDSNTLDLEAIILGERASILKKMLNSFPLYQWLLEHSHLLQFLRHTYFKFQHPESFREKGSTKPNTVITPHSEQDRNTIIIPRSEDSGNNVPAKSQVFGQALFHRMHTWCKDRKIHLLVTTTGWHFKEEPNDPTFHFMQRAEEIFKDEGIPYKDITPEVFTAMEGRPEDYIIPMDSHPNEKGSQLIAIYSWKWLHQKIDNILVNK